MLNLMGFVLMCFYVNVYFVLVNVCWFKFVYVLWEIVDFYLFFYKVMNIIF